MSEKPSLMSIAGPVAEVFGKFLAEYSKLLIEIQIYLKTVPPEELTKEKMDAFLENLTKEIVKRIPEDYPIPNMDLIVPDLIRTNFYMGMQASRELKKYE